jgi:hypothetical protein
MLTIIKYVYICTKDNGFPKISEILISKPEYTKWRCYDSPLPTCTKNNQKERDHWEEKDVGRWTILKWILER